MSGCEAMIEGSECFLFGVLVLLSDIWVRSDDRRESSGTSYIFFLAAPTPLLRAALMMCTAMSIPEICVHRYNGTLMR